MSIVMCDKCERIIDTDENVEDIISWDPVICIDCVDESTEEDDS